MTQYLCHVQEIEGKCCNCRPNCHQDRCIDVHWPAWSEKDTLKLTTYIMKLYERYNSYAMGICRPVMYPLLDNHKSEHSTLILSNR